MIALFFISALSIHSFFVHNNPFYVFLEDDSTENTENLLDQQGNHDKKIIKVKTISNDKNSEKVEVIQGDNSDFSKDSLENNSLEKNDNSSDEYEEIIFEDNFDKEYWSGTDDNYLEE